ncbi:MAG TPA: hypothetical protein VM266_11050 [Solirubrobacteraceae bacterium]|nr:hypothetical protein [Solirubrobacteraceae bacterium]
MSHPAPRPSRRQLEKRAYRLTLATGTSAVATLALLVLAIAGIGSFGLVFLLALVTAGLGFGLKRTLNP